MSNQKETILVQELQFGMFITELDRPWLESPFLLQGFILENEEQMQILKNLCQYVYVDRTKSVGDQFGERPKLNVSIQPTGFSSYKPTITTKGNTARVSPKIIVKSTSNNQQKSIKNASFYEIMSAIKQGDVTESAEGVAFNVRVISESKPTPVDEHPVIANETTSAGSFSFLKKLFQKKERFKDTINPGKAKQDIENDEDYRIMVEQAETPKVEQEMAVIYPTFSKSQQSIKGLFETIANAQKLDLSTVSDVLDSMVESITRTPDALMWLARLKSSHDGAYNHALNVSINAMAFASFLAMPKTHIKDIGLGGLLQGVGKTVIPKHILENTSVLTDAEYAIVKTHVDEALKLLKSNPDIPSISMQMVAEHHERYDGSGYPKGLSGDSISIHGQIGGLIDTYCALTTHRKHASSMHNLMALDEMRLLRGTQFSPELIDQIIQFFGIYPVSSLVELNTSEVAVVIQQNKIRRLLPRVMVVLAEDKTKYQFPKTLDLIYAPLTPCGDTYKILRSLAPDSYGLTADALYV